MRQVRDILRAPFRNERPKPCPECHHADHFMISAMRRDAPCFFKDPTQADGFCPCKGSRPIKNAEEFVEVTLGREAPMLRTHCGLCEYAIERESPRAMWKHTLPPQAQIEMTDEAATRWGQQVARWTTLTTTHEPEPAMWEGHDDRD